MSWKRYAVAGCGLVMLGLFFHQALHGYGVVQVMGALGAVVCATLLTLITVEWRHLHRARRVAVERTAQP